MSRRRSQQSPILTCLAGVVVLLIIGAMLGVTMVVVLGRLGISLDTLVGGRSTPLVTNLSDGPYQVFFTNPRYPDRSEDHHGGLDDQLTAFIARAQSSVDMAIYQLDLPNVTDALISAHRRGVRVRLVTDMNILHDPKENPSFLLLQGAGIPVVGGNTSGIMHNKFVVVDGKEVWTGSWNFTVNDTYRYNNNSIRLSSVELARNYTATFNKMFVDRLFGARRKSGGTTPRLTIDGITVENYFAPEDKVAEKIMAHLQQARTRIVFMAFSFTDDDIGAVIRERARAGIPVQGVFEKTGSETAFSEYTRMKALHLDVLQDGNPYLMHHKVFIIDGKTVLLGSFNFSKNAEENNDENLLILESESIAQQYMEEFHRIYRQAQNPPVH